MARNARIEIEASIQGLPAGSGGVVLQIYLATCEHERKMVDLASGANTITVPNTDVTVVIIVPPTTNTQTITLKGVSGDTGIALDVAKPNLISLSSVASFVLTTDGIINDAEIIFL